MKRQFLNLRVGGKIRLDTPAGWVILERGRKNHNFVLTVPDGIEAFNDDEIAWSASKYMKRGENDAPIPTYDLLGPVVDKTGKLVGVATPTMFRVNLGAKA